MSKVFIQPGRLCGTVRVPSSKSAGHRALLCAALAKGVSTIKALDASRDITVTLEAVRTLGASAVQNGSALRVEGGNPPRAASIDCGESGSTLRFLIPICAALGVETTFTGSGRLPERPIGVYLDLLPAHGVSCDTRGGLPLSISGRLSPGAFSLPGDISSQFITGLLFALPLLDGDSEIILTTELESAPYAAMTEETLRRFGITVTRTRTGWIIPGNQSYRPRDCEIEGDWSHAAFFLAAGALGGDLSISGLRPDSTQGDRAAERLFSALGAEVFWENGLLRARGGNLRGIDIDGSQIPDLVPALAAAAALAQGECRIYNASRLRIKESDRLNAMREGLNLLGAQTAETADGLVIRGVPQLGGGSAQGKNDHRIVMALAVAALRAERQTVLSDAQSIEKSYPGFFQDFHRLGGDVHVVLGE